MASILTSTYFNKALASKPLNWGSKMNGAPFAEVVSWFANALAVIAVSGALVALIVQSGDYEKVPIVAPTLAAVGVLIFLAGNILRYVFAAF
jgi:hypothetical protein